ncbi:hypothetical protein FOA52_001542 [Chlamydomonas sp. UWO 241]|nr:hypothetical protein FOA52_001542 [Chlamydomonas sp. UWO 241]
MAKIEDVSRFWTQLDLEGLRPRLDDEGLKVAEYQEEAVANRRKLAEGTKDFRRSVDKEDPAAKACGALLRQYQEEIDRLTKRAKHGEGAFLHLYQKLFEAPDPAPALSHAFESASRATELEASCRKLAQELAEYKAESTTLKNQDHTIRKLEEKCRVLELAMENKDAEVEEATLAAQAAADAQRIAAMQEREAELASMLAQAQASLVTMQRLHTASQNQLFAIQSATEEVQAGRSSELELASAELERAQERLAALEFSKKKLQERLTAEPGRSHGSDGGGAAASGSGGGAAAEAGRAVEESLRAELANQRDAASRMRSEVASLQASLDEAHSMWESRVEGLRSTLSATESHAAALEAEMGMRPTVNQVEDLRHQIRLLQAVRFNTALEAEDDDDAAPRKDGGPMGGGLDAALVAKARHLEHELTMARLRAVDVSNELDAALSRISDLEEAGEKQQALIDRLEEDLLASRGSAGAAGVAGAPGKQLSGLLEDGGGSGGDDGGAGGESMLRVLCSQRDRFRHKATEAEEELARVKTDLAAARSESATHKADNVALIERLKYVHAFQKGGGGGGGSGRGGGGDVETAGGGGAEVERRYTRMYEDGLNPFKEFQGQQKERQKSRMGVVDRAMYRASQLIFGNQGARLFAFVYFLLLHCLVLGLLARATHHSSGLLHAHAQSALDAKHDLMGAMHTIAGPGGDGVKANARLP